MKTMTNGKEIRRVPDGDAEGLARLGWKYCPKSVWKRVTRKREVRHG
jgi:hypothetical protein